MIKIQNIYYMLAYAYRALDNRLARNVGEEDFDYIEDLFASILIKSLTRQLKQGLCREYISTTEETRIPRGKINITDTVKINFRHDGRVVCTSDEYTENTYMNRIIKTTFLILVRSQKLCSENKKQLKRLLQFMGTISTIEPREINWSVLHYTKQNRTYILPMNVCRLVLKEMLATNENGTHTLLELNEKQLNKLYQDFILEYYRHHYPETHAAANHIKWNVDDQNIHLLPNMVTDITLQYKGHTLIIDAKYYNQILQIGRHGNKTIRSLHLYQIFSYVKNFDVQSSGKVSGMLLYAGNASEDPDEVYRMSGNKISVHTLNLNQGFDSISGQLDVVVNTWLSENNLGVIQKRQ